MTINNIMRNYFKQILSGNQNIYDFIKICELYLNWKRKILYEEEFICFEKIRRGGLVVDVGANYGQSALSINIVNPGVKILSFEPNPIAEKFLKMVKKWLGDNFEYKIVGVGEKQEELTFYIPIKNRIQLTQEGTFVKKILYSEEAQKRFGTPDEIKELKVFVLPLDSLNINPNGIKIDVQGMEFNVLKGAKNILKNCHPLLMIENSRYINQISEWLLYYKYKPFIIKNKKLYPYNENINASNVLFIN